MPEVLANGAGSSLNGAITAVQTTVPIQTADVAKFPSSGTYRIAISDGANTELCTVTAGQGTATLTVTRASESYAGAQTAFAFATGATVAQVLTSAALAALIGTGVGTGTRLRISANQALPASATTVISWDTEDTDADNQHFPSSAALTGTVAKTSGSNAIVGTSTLFTTELSVGQVISVPGVATEQFVVIAITDNTHITLATTAANTSSGQTATRLSSAIVFRQPGMWSVEFGAYIASVSAATCALQLRLNGTTPIAESGQPGVAANNGYQLIAQRPFQQWDYVETLIFQGTAGSVNLLTDERTHLAVESRPTVIVAVPYINIQDQKANNTAGQGLASGSWVTRQLTTIVSDTAGLTSLTTNTFTLPPGTYYTNTVVPGFAVDAFQCRLFNVTDSVVQVLGLNSRGAATGSNFSYGIAVGRFTLTATKTFRVEQQVQTTNSTNGGGAPMNFGSTEVYTSIEIWKEG